MDCSSVFPRHLPSCMCLEFHLLGPDPCPSQDMHRPHLTRSIVAPFLEQEQVLKKLFYPIVNFFCWHLLICTGLTSVRPTYKFVICFDTKIFLSGTKEEIPCDHFLVTMSLLRLFIDSDVWGKRNSFLVGEVGSVGRLPISFGRDPSVFWAGAQTTGPARASPERVVCLSLLALVQVSRAASARCGHWEVFLTHPWVAGWAVLFLCCPH